MTAIWKKLKASTDFDLLCTCGHTCGEHLGERAKHMGTGEVTQECLADGCTCTCYTKAKGQKPKLTDPHQAGHEHDRLQAAMWQKVPHGHFTPCIACGRPVDDHKGRTMLHLVQGGRFALAGETHDENDPGEMGWWPLGPACARKYDLSHLETDVWTDEQCRAFYGLDTAK